MIIRGGLLSTLTVALALGTAAQARAQGFISPMLGDNFGGVSGCSEIRGCTDKQRNPSLSLGKFGSIFGAETEVACAPDLFGEAPGLSSNVLTMMGSVMLTDRMGAREPGVVATQHIFTAVSEHEATLTVKKKGDATVHSVTFPFKIRDRKELEIP